ncbi:MAG: hypothetical protein ABEI52_01655 [Halobacteriaceae archaeon]
MNGDRRGQAHTLEGITAALLVLASVTFALQVTAVTPLTASTASQHIENQQRGAAAGMLAVAANNQSLKSTILYWNYTTDRFRKSDEEEGYYVSGGPPTVFGNLTEDILNDAGLAYNVNLVYLSQSRETRMRRLVYHGNPSDHAVTVGRIVTIYDKDLIRSVKREPTDKTVSNVSFFAPDIAPQGHLYNVIRVEVVIWQM